MPVFYVYVHGKNFRVRANDGRVAAGFYTHRYVTAESSQDAASVVESAINADPKIITNLINEPHDRPELIIEDIYPVSRQRRQGGYVFYSNDEDGTGGDCG